MNIKKSLYNIEVDKLPNGDILLFNSLSGAFGVMDQKTQYIYNNIEKTEEKNFSEDDLNTIQIMSSNGFFVDRDLDEYKKLELYEKIKRYSGKQLYLTIAPTLDCNMACPYCYEKKKKVNMSSEIKSGVIDFIKRKIYDYKLEIIDINWYGGEPLLEIGTIVDISKELINICKEKNIKYSARMVTNGILLSYENARILKEECKVESVQITIDGLKDTHNKRRILKNGGENFDVIVENIDKCIDLLNIIIRVNIDKNNISESKDLLQFFAKEKGWNDRAFVYFYPIVKYTDNCCIEKGSCYASEDFSHAEHDIINYMFENNQFFKADFLKPCPKAISCCALAVNTFVIDPIGDLYTCWDDVGVTNNKIGSIKEDITFNSKYIKWLTLELPHKCKSCNVLPLCQGGCPYVRMNNNNEPACHHRSFNYKDNLKLIYKSYLDRKTKKCDAI